MPKNLEIKSKVHNKSHVLSVVKALNAQCKGIMHQTDTYFCVQQGRLKLREIDIYQSELIYYNRIEEAHQRLSRFEVYSVENPQYLKEILQQALGVKAIVQKKRLLYMFDSTRIHIDEVAGLGTFLEFEIPANNSIDEAEQLLNLLILKFGIKEGDFLNNSYMDLILSWYTYNQ